MARARVALATALIGIVLAPVLGASVGLVPAVSVSAILAAIGIALFPETY